jgi:hypothetical protein
LTARGDEIPTCGQHKGVPLHALQPPSRIECVVKPEIDHVFATDDVVELFEFACSVMNCPEARLLAASKIEAIWENRAYNREVRPQGITLELLRANIAGLASRKWIDPIYYCSMLDYPKYGAPGSPKPPRRTEPLW